MPRRGCQTPRSAVSGVPDTSVGGFGGARHRRLEAATRSCSQPGKQEQRGFLRCQTPRFGRRTATTPLRRCPERGCLPCTSSGGARHRQSGAATRCAATGRWPIPWVPDTKIRSPNHNYSIAPVPNEEPRPARAPGGARHRASNGIRSAEGRGFRRCQTPRQTSSLRHHLGARRTRPRWWPMGARPHETAPQSL